MQLVVVCWKGWMRQKTEKPWKRRNLARMWPSLPRKTRGFLRNGTTVDDLVGWAPTCSSNVHCSLRLHGVTNRGTNSTYYDDDLSNVAEAVQGHSNVFARAARKILGEIFARRNRYVVFP
jgi:hypothetical protein